MTAFEDIRAQFNEEGKKGNGRQENLGRKAR
jgi:hypothetical protein